MRIPTPLCRYGYPETQLREILGPRFEHFLKWHEGQTGAICEGEVDGEPDPGAPHGFIVYRHDFENYLRGGVDYDLADLPFTLPLLRERASDR